MLFKEIKQSAAAAAGAPEFRRGALYQRGFDAIQTLYPGTDYAGNLALVFSQIKTLAGGDIRLDTPGGKVDVGLAGKVGGIRKEADELGIVAQQRGDVSAVALGNFNVNQSRVFTLGGGDIAIWSSKGDIDAGKGAKSAISAPPPITSVDENGNIVTIFPPIVSGSGIQAIAPADSNLGNGNVYLAAPAGVVNAGEAGIAGGQVVIAASAVVGASNIQASGGTVGVPTAVSPPVVPAGVSGAAAGAAKAATQSGGPDNAAKDQVLAAQQAADNEAQANLANNNLLKTEIIGYGACSVQDVLGGKAECGGESVKPSGS
ncbi:MAG: filamentous hemagglutinin family protein [Methylococcaceae bacterium]|nr:filamentous hemagglutinin family protein [Methylococcaceae bacterium]